MRMTEGLTLETSAFQIFYGANLTFISSFNKTTEIFIFHFPTEAAPQLLWNLEVCKFQIGNCHLNIIFTITINNLAHALQVRGVVFRPKVLSYGRSGENDIEQ